MGEQPKILEDDADTAAEAGQETAFGGLDVGAEDGQAASGGADGEVHQAEETGLAGAGWAEQPAEGAVRQREAEVVQDFRPGLGRRALAGSAVSQSDTIESHHANARFGRSVFLPLCAARRKRCAALPRTELSRNIGGPMRITCPSCSAGYEVPDSLMPAGRIVRCARCGSEWTPVAVSAVAAEAERADGGASVSGRGGCGGLVGGAAVGDGKVGGEPGADAVAAAAAFGLGGQRAGAGAGSLGGVRVAGGNRGDVAAQWAGVCVVRFPGEREVMDVVDAATGLAADSAVGVLRRQRPDFVRYSQGSHDVLMAPADPGGVSLVERAAVALHVASIERDAALVAHYQARLDELGGDRPARLEAILEHVALVAESPGSATRARLERLAEVGLSPRDIVVVTQIVAFVSYQARVAAGLRALGADIGR